MEPVEQNNPAGRLYAILSRAMAVCGSKPNCTAAELWAEVFDIEVSGSLAGRPLLEIISRILQIDKLIDETEVSLRQIEGLPDRYFRPFDRIRAIPRHSLIFLTGSIAGIVVTVKESDMTVLEFCSERLQAQHAEPIVDKNEITEILGIVAVLFDEVQESSLDAELKTFVFGQPRIDSSRYL